jgi:hypothetical protein
MGNPKITARCCRNLLVVHNKKIIGPSSCFSAGIIDYWDLQIRQGSCGCIICAGDSVVTQSCPTLLCNIGVMNQVASKVGGYLTHLYERIYLDTTALFQNLIADVGCLGAKK